MSEREPSGWAIGWTFFAAFMMIMIGGFHIIGGLAALLKNEFYVVLPNYVFKFDATTWGWIHLLVGILILLAGLGLFTGAVWARVIGVIMAVISALIGFAWIPVYPFWGIAFIAIAAAVIWALTAHGRDVTAG